MEARAYTPRDVITDDTLKAREAPNYDALIKQELEQHGGDFSQLMLTMSNMLGSQEGSKAVSEYLKRKSI